MRRKEMIGLLLAGGQGSRLGVLTTNKAKPAVFFGGQYRIIDFPMSNCINSGVDTIGVLTQYQPLSLNKHIGIGIPWDMDRKNGGVTILSPHIKGESGEWYSGTANAIFQNVAFIDQYDPDYVLILGTDHIYKMDYSEMLNFHKENNCDATIAVLEVPMEEASRMGIMNTHENGEIYEFEEKPKNPKSNLASMGIYIFTWSKLKEALVKADKLHSNSDFGKHIIPSMLESKDIMFAYRFKDFWRDVGTIEAYWETNMELIKTMPSFNLYEEYWKIYTDAAHQPPSYAGPDSDIRSSITSCGCEIYGKLYNSVLGPEVIIEEGACVQDSIIMEKCTVGKNTRLNRVIVDHDTRIGADVVIGEGENVPNVEKPDVYFTGISVIAENSLIPDGVKIGLNCVVSGITDSGMYADNCLLSGGSIIKEGASL